MRTTFPPVRVCLILHNGATAQGILVLKNGSVVSHIWIQFDPVFEMADMMIIHDSILSMEVVYTSPPVKEHIQ
jgi:hypothetical protein